MIENAHVETALLADGISTVDSSLSGCCKIEICEGTGVSGLLLFRLLRV